MNEITQLFKETDEYSNVVRTEAHATPLLKPDDTQNNVIPSISPIPIHTKIKCHMHTIVVA